MRKIFCLSVLALLLTSCMIEEKEHARCKCENLIDVSIPFDPELDVEGLIKQVYDKYEWLYLTEKIPVSENSFALGMTCVNHKKIFVYKKNFYPLYTELHELGHAYSYEVNQKCGHGNDWLNSTFKCAASYFRDLEIDERARECLNACDGGFIDTDQIFLHFGSLTCEVFDSELPRTAYFDMN